MPPSPSGAVKNGGEWGKNERWGREEKPLILAAGGGREGERGASRLNVCVSSSWEESREKAKIP